MDINKFLEMEPMKYVGGSAAKKHVANFLSNPLAYKDWMYSLKVDGEWSRIVHDLEGNVTVQGRGISRVTKLHTDNTEKVPHLVESIKNSIPKGTVLIGELSFEDFENTVQTEVGSILRSNPPLALTKQETGKGKLHIYVFDILAWDGEDLTGKGYSERVNASKDNCGGEYIHFLKTMKVGADAVEFLDEVLDSGQEGIMIMHKDGKYLPGSRSVKVSLKIKKELDEITCKVIGVIEPNRAYEGKEADFWEYKDEEGNLITKYAALGWKSGVEFEYKGNTVKVTSGISDEDAEWLASREARDLIASGQLQADITAMEEFITDGKPSLRHPVILKLRTDL